MMPKNAEAENIKKERKDHIMKELDMRGRQCPIPVLEAKKALGSPEGADGIAVRVDNEVAVQNLLRLAKSQGMEAEPVTAGEADFTVKMTAGAPGLKEAVKASSVEAPKAAEEAEGPIRKGMVAVIASDRMGEPDEALGRVLIKGFIYALAGQDLLPETVIFYNGGVRLSTEDSDSLKDLAQMEEMGVEILSCGTCLKHLGLEGKLKVGKVSNMYEIVEKMTGASLIVRP